MSLAYDLGYQTLGPVFRFFCHRLRLIERYKKGVPLLFLSRGGLRLHHFYGTYLEANALEPLSPARDFYISRMAAFRALLAQQSCYAADEIAREYGYQPVGGVMRCFLPDTVFNRWQKAFEKRGDDPEQPVSAGFLLRSQLGDCAHGAVFREHTIEQRALLAELFAQLRDGDDEAILVDTGWSGSIVKALQDLFPEIAITAAYFGRFNYGKPQPPWFHSITGLVLQHENFSPTAPQSALVFHRHLIESVCEPPWPSVEYYRRHGDEVIPASGIMPEGLKIPSEGEDVARAIGDYLGHECAATPAQLVRDYHSAIHQLSRILKYPTRQQALAFGMPPRSADFGRALNVPVLLARTEGGSAAYRLKHSLWRQGQAALEFGLLRRPVQWLVTWRSTSGRILAHLRRLAGEWLREPAPRKAA